MDQRFFSTRPAILAVCVSAAFAAALILRENPAPPPVAESVPAPALTAAQILAALPNPDGPSSTEKALRAGRQHLEKKPDDTVVWVQFGDALAQQLRDTADQKFYGFAEMAYQRALALDVRSAGAMAGMAWVEGGRHDFEKSTAWAKAALAIKPQNVEAHGILGDGAVELGRYDEAFAHYQTMMDLRPDLSSWSRGAHLLWLTGDQEKAVWLMEKAIKAGAPFAENTAWCRAQLAMMLFQDGALDDAAAVIEPALQSAPRNTQVLLAAGRIATARQDFSTARRHYEAVLAAGPNHEAFVALGDLLAVQGEKEDAEKCYAQVEALHTAHLASAVHDHMAMAKFYADHDRNLIEALRLAEQHKRTENVLEADTLAWVYFKNGDLPRASEASKRALTRNTPDAEIHYHAGLIAAAFGGRSAAQKHLQEALSRNPRFNPLQAPLAAAALEKLASPATVSATPPQP